MPTCPNCESPLKEDVRPLVYSGIEFGRFKILFCEVCKHSYNPRETSTAIDLIAQQYGLFAIEQMEQIDIDFSINQVDSICKESFEHTQNNQIYTAIIAGSKKWNITSVITDLCEAILRSPFDACVATGSTLNVF